MGSMIVGAGGWAYFQVQGGESLRAYSSAFDFVEVNSTYYEYPDLQTVRGWRSRVPQRFEFSVRCNKEIGLALRTKGPVIDQVMEKMEEICGILRANILTILVPDRVGIDEALLAGRLEEAISSFHGGGTRIAVETRGGASKKVLRTLQDNDAVHCVDISKETPAYDSNVLYSRLFGRGHDNIYQFDDEELEGLAEKASAPTFEKSILAFHGVRMYGDAARLKAFLHTGKFLQVTGQTGLNSLGEVLREDTTFPTSKSELVAREGWKLFDLTVEKRVRAAVVLSRLPEKTYDSLDDVMVSLKDQSPLEAQSSRTTRAKSLCNS